MLLLMLGPFAVYFNKLVYRFKRKMLKKISRQGYALPQTHCYNRRSVTLLASRLVTVVYTLMSFRVHS